MKPQTMGTLLALVGGVLAYVLARSVLEWSIPGAMFASLVGVVGTPLLVAFVGMKVTAFFLGRSPEGRAALATLNGGGAPDATLAREWQDFLREAPRMGVDKEIIAAGESVLMPLKVSPLQFFENYMFLSVDGADYLLPSDTPKPRPTPSLVARPHRAEWPIGSPTWFIAAFPDVSHWMSETIAQAELKNDPKAVDALAKRDELLLRTFQAKGIREDDEAAIKAFVQGPDGKMGLGYARLLVEWYLEATKRRLETAAH